MSRLYCLIGILVLLASTQAAAQEAADPEAGLALAQEHCVRCHDINPGGAFKQDAPSFAAIAIFRSADQIHDRIWFPPVHARMPPFSQYFQREDVDNLTAYIVSLEGT